MTLTGFSLLSEVFEEKGETKVWRECMRQSFIGTSRSAAPSAHDGILLLLCFLEWRLIFLKEEAMPKPF